MAGEPRSIDCFGQRHIPCADLVLNDETLGTGHPGPSGRWSCGNVFVRKGLCRGLVQIVQCRSNSYRGRLIILEEYFGSSSARRAAGYFDRIFKGEKQPIYLQAPTKYELASKLKTAKALGLEIPSSVLSRADEVIE